MLKGNWWLAARKENLTFVVRFFVLRQGLPTTIEKPTPPAV